VTTADKVGDGTSVVGRAPAALATVAYSDRRGIKGDARLVTPLPSGRSSCAAPLASAVAGVRPSDTMLRK